jgi:pyruvate dehydrogenase E1 component beta subunit
MEHKELWGLQGEVEVQPAIALGKAHLARAGTDLTLVSWSGMLRIALAAAEDAARQGISVEVIDLRTIWPWDRELVLESAARTGRLLVAHEAVQAAGFGAEVAATVAEELGIPVRRVGAARIPAGYARTLEDVARISAQQLLHELKLFVESSGRRR